MTAILPEVGYRGKVAPGFDAADRGSYLGRLMVSCPRCGANIDPSALACPYCQTQTAYGKQHAEQQAAYRYHAAQAEQARAAHERGQRHAALAKKAQHALLWSIGGTLVCCFPAAIVGLVMGLNVKSAAKRDGVVAPGTSTVAVVMGVVACALFCVMLTIYIRDSRATEERIAALQAQTDGARDRERLERGVACALTELELLKEGFAGTTGINISGFECDGKLEQDGDRATLPNVRFRTSSRDRREVAACLSRGGRWSVKELREDGRCEPRGSVAPAASGR
jgi:zinc-ribbon domain